MRTTLSGPPLTISAPLILVAKLYTLFLSSSSSEPPRTKIGSGTLAAPEAKEVEEESEPWEISHSLIFRSNPPEATQAACLEWVREWT